jgi:hypothetical protein
MKIIPEGTIIPKGFSRTKGTWANSVKVWAFYWLIGSWAGKSLLARCTVVKHRPWYKTAIRPKIFYFDR